MNFIKNVEADSSSFSKVESHFAYPKCYLKNDNISKVMHAEIFLIKRENIPHLKSLTSTRKNSHEGACTFNSEKGKAFVGTTKTTILKDEKASKSPVLHYVPQLRHRKDELPFVECPKGLKVGDVEILKESFTTPLTKITKQEIKLDLTKANLP